MHHPRSRNEPWRFSTVCNKTRNTRNTPEQQNIGTPEHLRNTLEHPRNTGTSKFKEAAAKNIEKNKKDRQKEKTNK